MLLRPVTKAETGPLPCHSGTSGKVHTNGEEGWLPWSACEFCGPLKKKSQSVSNRATILFYQAYMTMTVQSNTINQSISRIGQTCWITLGTYQITETDLQIIPLCWSRTCVFFFSENSSFVKHRYLGHSSLPPLPVHLPDAPAILHFKFLQNSLGRAQELFIHYSERGLLQGHLFLIVGVRALRRNHWKHYQPPTNGFRCPCQLLELEPPIIHATTSWWHASTLQPLKWKMKTHAFNITSSPGAEELDLSSTRFVQTKDVPSKLLKVHPNPTFIWCNGEWRLFTPHLHWIQLGPLATHSPREP